MLYCEWACNAPVAVRDLRTGERWWFDEFRGSDRDRVFLLPRYDLNRKRFVK